MNRGLWVSTKVLLAVIIALLACFLIQQAQIGHKMWKQGFYFGKLQAYSHSIDILNQIDKSKTISHKYAVILTKGVAK